VKATFAIAGTFMPWTGSSYHLRRRQVTTCQLPRRMICTSRWLSSSSVSRARSRSVTGPVPTMSACRKASAGHAQPATAPGGLTIGGMGEGAEPPWTAEQKATIIAELQRKFPERQLYPVQRGNFASQWKHVAHSARLQDASSQDPRKSWVPPGLVAAVRRTRLSRFYPFAVHEYLYFADGPGVWDEKGEVAPVCVGRSRPEGYLVLQRPPGKATYTLTTQALTRRQPRPTGFSRAGHGAARRVNIPAAPGFDLPAKASRLAGPPAADGAPRQHRPLHLQRTGHHDPPAHDLGHQLRLRRTVPPHHRPGKRSLMRH
jgi:hypothetical protein